MGKEWRKDYNFRPETKILKLHQVGCRCELCGEKLIKLRHNYLYQAHHILGVRIAKDYYPEIPKNVIRSKENMFIVDPECHAYIHQQDWFVLFAHAHARYLIDTFGIQPRLWNDKKLEVYSPNRLALDQG